MDRRISPPFVRQAVEQGREKLRAAGIDSPKLCAEVLLASVLDIERTWLVLHFDYRLNAGELVRYQDLPLKDAVKDLKTSAKVLGGNKDAFAYPFGDYNDKCVEALKKSGFLCGVTT